MKLTTKSVYAIKSMIYIRRYGDKPVGVQKMSEDLDISHKYLEQIVSALKGGGYLQSIRGTGGGYILNKDANDVSIFDIMNLMDGFEISLSCARDKNCSKCDSCAIFWLISLIKEEAEGILKKITLEKLASLNFPMGKCE